MGDIVAYRFFTPEEDALVLAKEVPDAILARQLDRTTNSISNRRQKLLRGRVELSEEQKQKRRMSTKAWRKKNPQLSIQRKAENYALGALYKANAYQPWSPQDDEAITAANRVADRELAKKIKRTVRAIQGRRGKLKQIQAALDQTNL